ncbi:MAG: hypothetical protein ACI9NT_000856 [Bacteroidia bacterium]|jgi:hypothetical protein
MHNSVVGRLCFHGAIVMFVAFFTGLMMGFVAVGQAQGSMDDWNLAHMEALVNSIVLFAVAGVIDKLSMSAGRANLVSVCLVLMAYCNAVFGLMRGFTGAAGFEFGGSMANNITALAGMLGVPLAVIAFTLILISAASLRNKAG